MILNIRAFHAPDATIQDSIEKSSQNSSKIDEKWSKKGVKNQTPCRGPFLEPFRAHFCIIWKLFWIRNPPFGAQIRPKSIQMDPKWLQKGSPTGCLILNSSFNQFSLIFELFLGWFFDAVLDRRIWWMKNANVQNQQFFTIDFKDFTVATKSENHSKIFEKLC